MFAHLDTLIIIGAVIAVAEILRYRVAGHIRAIPAPADLKPIEDAFKQLKTESKPAVIPPCRRCHTTVTRRVVKSNGDAICVNCER